MLNFNLRDESRANPKPENRKSKQKSTRAISPSTDTTDVKPKLSLVKSEPIDQNIETIKNEPIEYIDTQATTKNESIENIDIKATTKNEPKVNFNFILKKTWQLCFKDKELNPLPINFYIKDLPTIQIIQKDNKFVKTIMNTMLKYEVFDRKKNFIGGKQLSQF